MISAAWKLRRWIYFLIAPAVCLILFWRAPFNWFLNDDFAWLALPLDIDHLSDIGRALFSPKAQGTVRVFSERLYFLTFGSFFEMNAFSINALPFHVWALLTWFADLALAAVIGARLTGSRWAGLAGAILWTCHGSLTYPLMWASAYNQILCALCVLTAFYARLRWLEDGEVKERGRWIALEWIAYLVGFGALEIIVIYPAVALLYALCFGVNKKHWLGTIALFVPALIFTAVHFLLVPKTAGLYALAIDGRLPATFLNYLEWGLAPALIGDLSDGWRRIVLISAAFTGIALLVFAARRLREGNRTPLFCIGWFVLFLLPVLPLPDHLTDYYVTLPVLGLAWLAGWAIESVWNTVSNTGNVPLHSPTIGFPTIAARAVAIAAVAAYLTGSIRHIEIGSAWVYDRSKRMREMLRAVDEVAQKYSGTAIILAGVDNPLIQSGMLDGPFRLYGLQSVYLAPGSEHELSAGLDSSEIGKYVITVQKAVDLLDRSKARVLYLGGNPVTDVTRSYTALLHTGVQASRHNFVNVGDAVYAAQLGPSWYKLENGTRWMGKSATVRLDGIEKDAQALFVTGYAPPALIDAGPVTMRFRGNEHDIGREEIVKPAGPFSLSFPLPKALLGQSVMEIEVSLSRVFMQPGDERDLGVVFGTFSVR
jgi:hypothetical protein